MATTESLVGAQCSVRIGTHIELRPHRPYVTGGPEESDMHNPGTHPGPIPGPGPLRGRPPVHRGPSDRRAPPDGPHTVVNLGTGADVLTYELAEAPTTSTRPSPPRRRRSPAGRSATPGERARRPAPVRRRPRGARRGLRPAPESLQCGKPLKLTSRVRRAGHGRQRGLLRRAPPVTSGAVRAGEYSGDHTSYAYGASRSGVVGSIAPGTTRSRWPPGRSSRRSPRATPSCKPAEITPPDLP